MKKTKEPLKIVGILLIILGAVIILSAFPVVQQSIFPVDKLAEKVPTTNATRLIVGLVLGIFGLIVYLGEKGLKILKG